MVFCPFFAPPALLVVTQASVCVLHPQWRKHHDNLHELSKREGRSGLGSVSDHNSLRVKRKRRRPTKTEFPSPEHRGDGHEEGTAVKGNVFSWGCGSLGCASAAGPSCCCPEAERPLELVASHCKPGS